MTKDTNGTTILSAQRSAGGAQMDDLAVKYLPRLHRQAAVGTGDSDAHALTLFSIAHASRGKTFVELGVRDGGTTLSLLLAAHMNGGKLYSVDINPTGFECPPELADSWEFIQSDAVEFLAAWDPDRRMDIVYVDDWHAYPHVKRELELLDRLVGPSSVILVHDLMYGNHEPFYHSDISLQEGQWAHGGPYRAVAELDPQFWEWSTLPWCEGLTILRKKYSRLYHPR